jgi:O-antigen/teichoic acid export membrane protein
MPESSEAFERLFNSFLLILTSYFFGNVLAVGARLLVIRSLSPSRFGLLALSFTIASIVAQVSGLGLPRGVANKCSSAEDESEQFDYITSAYRYAVLAGIVSALLVYFVRGEIARVLGKPEVELILGFFVIYVLIYPVKAVTTGAIRGYEQSRGAAIARDVGPKLGGIFVLAAFIYFGQPFEGAIAYRLLLPIISVVLGVWYLWDLKKFYHILRRKSSRDRSRELLDYSWPLAIETGLGLLMLNMDIIILGYFLQENSVGLYKATHPIWGMTMIFNTAFSFLYFPMASRYHTRRKHDSLRTLYTVTTKWVVTMTFPLTLFITVYSESVLRELFSQSYTPAQTALSILAAGMFFRVFVGPNALTIEAVELTKIDLIASALGILANLVLNILLIPWYGIAGAAVATVVGFGIYNGVEVIILDRYEGIHPFTWKLIKPLVPTTAVSIIFSRLTSPDSILQLALLGILIAGVHVASIIATHSYQPEDVIIIEQIETKSGVDLGPLQKIKKR